MRSASSVCHTLLADHTLCGSITNVWWWGLLVVSGSITWDPLYGEQAEHGQPVEHIMYGGASECAPELVAVRGVAQGHDGVGDGGADVGAHHHEDGWPHWQDWNRKNMRIRLEVFLGVQGGFHVHPLCCWGRWWHWWLMSIMCACIMKVTGNIGRPGTVSKYVSNLEVTYNCDFILKSFSCG